MLGGAKLIAYGIGALAIAGLIALALVWHAGKVRGVEERATLAERIKWEEQRRRSEIARSREKLEAETEIATLERELTDEEDRADAEAAALRDALAAATAGLTCEIPDAVMGPLRGVR